MQQSADSNARGRQGTVSSRKQRILDAALSCFARKGYGATTMAEIRELADASTGSIYHHFKSKEQIAAGLYLEGVRATQQAGLEALGPQQDARTGIFALVAAYLDWVAENSEHASFLFAMRHADFIEPVEPQLDAMNRRTFEDAGNWFRERMGRGELPDLEPEILRAILYGPAAHYARRHVAGTTAVGLETAKQQLGQAAWHGLQALLQPSE
ncbi:MAG: TetR/AcrR family transcriptional regulator [Myxococcales bacterium]|nr:TetR/AcrR family transcriptional regulator [Myxococcales bacterium]